MFTNLILSLLVSTNATLHWERSPDPGVTGYVVYSSPVSRFTNERRAVQQTVPTLPGQTQQSIVTMRSFCVGTNADWKAMATPYWTSNTTQMVVPADSTRRYFAATAKAPGTLAEVESDLSNEVLFDPQWAFVNFCIEGSTDMKDWYVMGTTNVLRFWRGLNRSGNIPAFFRGRLVITNK